MNKVTIKVPATTGNLGPGFDTFGLALNLYNTLTFELTDGGLVITGCDERYADADNMAYVAYKAVADKLGIEENGVKIDINADIPVCRGLGSSAAMLAAGAMAANILYEGGLSYEDILSITTEIEGHPDNLAPAIFGGLTVSMMDKDNKPISVNYHVDENWRFVALVPDFELSTFKARAALPDKVSINDAVFNISHGALVLKALETGDEELLRISLQDRLHQDYRNHLIRDYDIVRDYVTSHGGAFCISGAGPTLMCITKNDELAAAIEKDLSKLTNANWKALVLQADNNGIQY